MSIKLIIELILAAVVVLFILQNVTTMELTFLFLTLSMSRALLMFLILSIGILLGWLLHGSSSKIKTIPLQNKAL